MATYAAGMKDAGMAQDFQTGMAWDPAMIVIDALRKVGPNATADQLHDYIENLHGYIGITGTYDFRDGSQRGIGVDSTMIMRWDPDEARLRDRQQTRRRAALNPRPPVSARSLVSRVSP